MEVDRDNQFSWVSVWLFGAHPIVIAVFTPAQKIKGGNELEFDSIEPNKTGVNTPLKNWVPYKDIIIFQGLWGFENTR